MRAAVEQPFDEGLRAERLRQGTFADNGRTLSSSVAGAPAAATTFTDPAAFRRIRIGVADALGDGVSGLTIGERVGIPWLAAVGFVE